MCLVCQFIVSWTLSNYNVCLHLGKTKSIRSNELFRPLTFQSNYKIKSFDNLRLLKLFFFQAPYLPWVLVAFSVLLGNSVLVDILGIAIGHLYFFLEDVFPNQPGGRRLLTTPRLLYLSILFPKSNSLIMFSSFYSGKYCSIRTWKILSTIQLPMSVPVVSIGALQELIQRLLNQEKMKTNERKKKHLQNLKKKTIKE